MIYNMYKLYIYLWRIHDTLLSSEVSNISVQYVIAMLTIYSTKICFTLYNVGFLARLLSICMRDKLHNIYCLWAKKVACNIQWCNTLQEPFSNYMELVVSWNYIPPPVTFYVHEITVTFLKNIHVYMYNPPLFIILTDDICKWLPLVLCIIHLYLLF